ncbi:MAG: HipA domain-containing protein [Halobacteriovoraceae bacterium]|nr:HipA domain-containing protein [Halobacteriovoraceae bacterium]
MSKKNERKHIYVYADWIGVDGPFLMGVLSIDVVRGEEVFSFSYDENWIRKGLVQELDPDLQYYSEDQYLEEGKSNFGAFTDSCPDRWGRILMQRYEAILARKESRTPRKLYESDYLLRVYDGNRMGALRFKLDLDGDFLNNKTEFATPPWARLRELEQASLKFEEEGDKISEEYIKWLNMLISPGSSLGGARPKASVVDEKGNLWIAKFPSKHDDTNIGGWEMVAYQIALEAGVNMSECKARKFNNDNYTFLTKRFDREQNNRIHFASAMTCLGKVDGSDHTLGVSYLDLAEFIIRSGSNVDEDLEELWRRIVLSICISNVDDHLRNHGFILEETGWRLSPAYDINPSADGEGLNLNISEHDNSQSLELALSVIEYFRITEKRAKKIVAKVKASASKWRELASELGISRTKQDLMARAFRVVES